MAKSKANQKTHKRFMVVRATRRSLPAVSVDGKEMKFRVKNGSFDVRDPGLAAEINARYGVKGQEMPGDVVVVPIHNSYVGHTWQVPALPWKK